MITHIYYKYFALYIYTMPLSFTSPNGFRFFSLMVMITTTILSLAKSLVDQIPEPPLVRFCSINIIGFILFLGSLIYGRKLHEARYQWFNNAFLVSGIVLITYGSTVEVEGAIHSTYLPIFYIIEILILLMVGNKVKMEDTRMIFHEMSQFQTTTI